MPAKNDDEKKVMDVASPGESKPETGSKPMVVGHKFLSADPDVKSTDAQNDNAANNSKEETTAIPKKKIVLAPISENIKTEEEKTDDTDSVTATSEEAQNTEPPKQQETDAKDNNDIEENTTQDPEIEEATKERTAEEKQSDEDKASQEKEAHLQEIIKSKEYYIPIKHHGASAAKTFLITFILVCLVGAVLLAVLMDAGIIDLGVQLPFDFL